MNAVVGNLIGQSHFVLIFLNYKYLITSVGWGNMATVTVLV